MEIRRSQGRLKPGTPKTRPRRRAVDQWCTPWPTVKCIITNAWEWKRNGWPCTYLCSYTDWFNKGPILTPPPRERTQACTALRLTTNASKTIADSNESAPILCQVAHQDIFHPYKMEFSPPVPTNGAIRTAPLAGSDAAPAAHTLTDTASPNSVMPEAVGSGKKIEPRTTNRRSCRNT